MIRCKFVCKSVAQDKNQDGTVNAEHVSLEAVIGSEVSNEGNSEWSRWTPSGNLDFAVTNPNAFGKVKEGQEYYIDITPVPAETPAQTG